jgi:uncharacterized protein VirK/YbjX
MPKALLRSLVDPVSFATWWRFASRLHRSVGASPPEWTFVTKPVRGYMYSGLGRRGRVRLLKNHYRYLTRVFSETFVARLCDRQRFEAAMLNGRKGSQFIIELIPSTISPTNREGELVLVLRAKDGGILLSRLTFAFVERDERVTLMIGGLQGPRFGHKREIIDATRLLHGLRPKDACLLAARALAGALGIETHAVTNAAYVLRHKQVAKFTDYDEYWRERGGKQLNAKEFSFDPLGLEGEADGGREGIKAAIVSGIRSLVDANRRAGAA